MNHSHRQVEKAILKQMDDEEIKGPPVTRKARRAMKGAKNAR